MRTQPLLLLLCALPLAGCGVTEVVDRDEEGQAILVRSPQPDEDDLEELHRAHGIKTVLNLRGGTNPDRGWYKEEREGVRAIGAEWVHLGISGSRPPLDHELETFFALVEDRERWPILLHCQGGIHRTGALVALYRMQYEGWPNQRAVEEMEDRYFNWTTRDRSALKEWLLRYQRDPRRRLPEGAKPPPPAGPPPGPPADGAPASEPR